MSNKLILSLILCILILLFVSGCDKRTDKKVLQDVIDYIDENSGISDAVYLCDWYYTKHDKGYDVVDLYYCGSIDIKELEKLRSCMNEYVSSHPDDFISHSKICITLTYNEYDRHSCFSFEAVGRVSNCYGASLWEHRDSRYLRCLYIEEYNCGGHRLTISESINCDEYHFFEIGGIKKTFICSLGSPRDHTDFLKRASQ